MLATLQESLVMSMFANGTARTMKANYTINKEDIRVIRPLAYVRESATKEFAMKAKLPVISENCPACFEVPKERKRVKKLLAEEEIHNPKLFGNLKRALLPFMGESMYTFMKDVHAEIRTRNADRRRGGAKRKASV